MININFSFLLWILLYIVIIAVIIGIIWLSIIYYKTILETMMIPRLRIGFKTAKFLSKFISNERLNLLLNLRDQLDNRFGHFSEVPFTIVIGNQKPKWFFEGSIHKVESSDLLGIINGHMGILWIQKDSLEITLCLWNDIMEGRSHTSIVFNENLMDIIGMPHMIASQINETYKLIYGITNINCNSLILLNSNNIFSAINGGLISAHSSLGMKFLQNSEFYYEETFQHFTSELRNIFLCDPDSQPITLSHINLLEQSHDNIMDFLYKLDCDLGGLYFSSVNTEGCELFTQEVFTIHGNNISNKFQIKERKNARNLYEYIILFILGLIGFFGLLSISYSYNHRNKFMATLENCKDYMINYNDQNLWDDISYLQLKPSFINSHIFEEQIHKVHDIAHSMIEKQLANSPINRVFLEEFFNFSPVETKNFFHLERAISELILRLDSKHLVISKSMNNKIKEYDNSIRANILKCFDSFFNTFINNNLLVHLDQLTSLLNQMNSKFVTINQLIDIKEVASLLQQLFGVSSNSWWINKSLGSTYDALVDKVGLVDNNLKLNILQNQEFALQKFTDKILSTEHILCGKILALESQLDGKKLNFTQGFQTLLSGINYITQEPLVAITSPEVELEPIPENFYFMWDLNALDELIAYSNQRNNLNITITNTVANRPNGQLLANIMLSIVDNNLRHYYNNMIKQAHTLKPQSIAIEDKVGNFIASQEKLNIISNFMRVTLGNKMYFLEDIKHNSLKKIMSEVKTWLNNSIFTAYTRLKTWNYTENLVEFLFQCSNEEVGIIFSKIIINIQQMKNRVLVPLLPHLNFDLEEYEFAKYIIDQVNKYENNTFNHLKSFEDFILSLRDWKIVWRPPVNLVGSNREFFLYHLMAFKGLLVGKTNALSYDYLVNSYNKLAQLFNERLAGKFPFGGTVTNALTKDIIVFLNQYRNIRESFYENKVFMDIFGVRNTLKQIDLISELFIIEGNNLFVNVKMDCILKDEPGAQNNNLILRFHNKFGDVLFESDNVNLKYNIQEPYLFDINCVNSSIMKLDNVTGAKILNSSVRFEFFDNFGFLAFVENYRYKQVGDDTVIKLTIPIIQSDNKAKSSIILFLKVFNWPVFPFKIEAIKTE